MTLTAAHPLKLSHSRLQFLRLSVRLSFVEIDHPRWFCVFLLRSVALFILVELQRQCSFAITIHSIEDKVQSCIVVERKHPGALLTYPCSAIRFVWSLTYFGFWKGWLHHGGYHRTLKLERRMALRQVYVWGWPSSAFSDSNPHLPLYTQTKHWPTMRFSEEAQYGTPDQCQNLLPCWPIRRRRSSQNPTRKRQQHLTWITTIQMIFIRIRNHYLGALRSFVSSWHNFWISSAGVGSCCGSIDASWKPIPRREDCEMQ